MTKYNIYQRSSTTDGPGQLIGSIEATSRIEAAWYAWQRWSHRTIYVVEADKPQLELSL